VPARRLALVALLGLAIPVVTTRPAMAVKAGDWCGPSKSNEGELSTDPLHPAAPLVCRQIDGAQGFRWQPGSPVAGSPGNGVPDAAAPAGAPARQALPAESAGRYCATPGVQVLDQNAQVLECQSNRWTAAPAGSATSNTDPLDAQVNGISDPQVDGISESIAPALSSKVLGNAPAKDPLPYDLGNPTGLPPGVTLPPGTTVWGGYPKSTPSDDWWKAADWITEGTVSGSNLEAVNTYFAQQCANIGWLFDPRRVSRLPSPTPPAKGYDYSAQMVVGECRTVLGSSTDPTRLRPWYLKWGITQQPGSPVLDLVVQLGSEPHEGGRPG